MADDLFQRMQREAEAAFALAAGSEGVEVAPGRESDLVNMALTAGIVGALTVDRDASVPAGTDLSRIHERLDQILAILRPDR